MRLNYFISDLHLQQAHPQGEKKIASFISFCSFLENRNIRLFILGDLFDVWIGDDAMLDQASAITQALRKMRDKGCELFFQCGNRDFLIGDLFLEQSGCTSLGDEVVVNLNKKKVLLDHGEIFCFNDVGAQIARNKSRDPLFQKQLLSLTPAERWNLQKEFSATSRKHKEQTDQDILRPSKQLITECIRKHDCDILIYGHTHQTEFFTLDIEGKKRNIINLGCWSIDGAFNFAVLDGSEIQLHKSEDYFSVAH